MKKTSTLEKKLLKYSAMASGVIAIGSTADAQIVYYDENPDVIVTGHQQGAVFDFDGDANNDITIATFDASQTGTYDLSAYGLGIYNYTLYYKAVVAFPYTGAAVMATSGDAAMLNSGMAINSVGAFDSNTLGVNMAGVQSTLFTPAIPGYGSQFGPYSNGMWHGAVDKYLGIRFTSAGNLHYGWMRMDVDAGATTVTIKDWAYNSVADGAINAGDMGAGSVAVGAEELALVRFGNNRIDIQAVSGTNGNINVVNMEGKVVYNTAMNAKIVSVDLNNFAAGLYIVNAQFNEGAISHKVVVR